MPFRCTCFRPTMLLAIGNNRGGRPPAATATVVVVVVVAAVAMFAATAASASTDDEETDQSDFDDMWETNLKQEDFDGMPLPDDSELSTTTTASPITAQPSPVVVKIGDRYGVLTKGSTKEKDVSGLKDYFPDNLVGVSVGTVISLGSLAMVAMASKALLLALGAILLTCLGSGWTVGGGGGGGGTTHKSDKTVPVGIVGGDGGTVFEVIAKPHVSYGHTYSSEIHYEPYAPPQQPVQSQSSYPTKQPASNVHTYDFTYEHRPRRDVR